MSSNDKDRKSISKIKGAKGSQNVEKAQSVGDINKVDKVKGAEAIGKVKATEAIGAVRGAGAISGTKSSIVGISREQRARILAMVEEEAEKMAKEGIISQSKKDIVKKSVSMAVDAAIVLDEDLEKK